MQIIDLGTILNFDFMKYKTHTFNFTILEQLELFIHVQSVQSMWPAHPVKQLMVMLMMMTKAMMMMIWWWWWLFDDDDDDNDAVEDDDETAAEVKGAEVQGRDLKCKAGVTNAKLFSKLRDDLDEDHDDDHDDHDDHDDNHDDDHEAKRSYKCQIIIWARNIKEDGLDEDREDHDRAIHLI